MRFILLSLIALLAKNTVFAEADKLDFMPDESDFIDQDDDDSEEEKY